MKVRRVKKLLGAQMEAVVAGTWAVAVLRLPMALLLLAMSTLATSRVPGTRPFRPDPALLLLLWTESGATASQKHQRLRIYPWPTTSTRFPHLSAVQAATQYKAMLGICDTWRGRSCNRLQPGALHMRDSQRAEEVKSPWPNAPSFGHWARDRPAKGAGQDGARL